MQRSFVLSTLTLIGTIIGAGVFALPHVFARVGLFPASLLFAAFTALVAYTHASYVDVVLQTPTTHRLPGYARTQLGGHWGGGDLYALYPGVWRERDLFVVGWGVFASSHVPIFGTDRGGGAILLVFMLGATAVRGNLRRVAIIEAVATFVMVALFLAVAGTAAGRAPAVTQFVPHLSWSVFGVFLFALSGLPVIGEVVDMCKRKRAEARAVAVVGTILAGVIMWTFAFFVARAGGTLMTQDPRSLLSVLPTWASWTVPLLGLLAIGTSYVTTAEDLETSWRHDYRFGERSAWLMTVVPPLVIALGLNDGFLLLATVLGTVCGGLNGVLVGMMRVASGETKRAVLVVAGGLVVVFIYAFGLAGQLVSWIFCMMFPLRAIHISFWLFVGWLVLRVWEMNFEVSPLPAIVLPIFVFLVLFALSFGFAKRLQKRHAIDRLHLVWSIILLVLGGFLWEFGLTLYLGSWKAWTSMFTWRFWLGIPVQMLAIYLAHVYLRRRPTETTPPVPAETGSPPPIANGADDSI